MRRDGGGGDNVHALCMSTCTCICSSTNRHMLGWFISIDYVYMYVHISWLQSHSLHIHVLTPPTSHTYRAACNAAASSALKKKLIRRLEVAAKHTAAVSTQLIAAAQGAGASNRNEASQSQLINHCQAVAEQISALVQSVRYSMANPDSPSAQLGLINSSQTIIPVSVCVYLCMCVCVCV